MSAVMEEPTREMPAVPEPPPVDLERHLRVIEMGYRLAGSALAVGALALLAAGVANLLP